MIILGVADGVDSGATLVIDDAVVARARSRDLGQSEWVPWCAIDRVLREASISRGEVDRIAIAGRVTPSLSIRKNPMLQHRQRTRFSNLGGAGWVWRATVERTGLSSLSADAAEAWFTSLFLSRGFTAFDLYMVHIHSALSAAAHCTQPLERALAVVLQPGGDGLAVSVSIALSNNISRVWSQQEAASLYLHLARCFEVIGAQYPSDCAHVWKMADRAEPDQSLVGMLQAELDTIGPALVRRRHLLGESPRRGVYPALKRVPMEVAAASILQNLTHATLELVAHHVNYHGIGDLVLAGSLFESEKIVDAVKQIGELNTVWVIPLTGAASLSLGAAAVVAGLGPGTSLPAGLVQ